MSNNNNDEDKPDRNLVNVEKADDTVNSDVVDDKTVGQAVGESDEKLVANDVSGADEEDEDDCQEEVDKMKFLAWVQSRFAALDIDEDDDSPSSAPASALRTPPSKLEGNLSLQGVADYIKSGKCSRICFMTGAGISTAAGIPDFRSPGSGLYDTMAAKFNLSQPQSLFEIDYYLANPGPFLYLAKELLNARVKPTTSHYFQRLLHEKGLLLRSFTQNIDALESMAGLPDDKVVEAHGSTKGAHCLSCKKPYSQAWFQSIVLADSTPSCEDCNALVKPDIVFFGENLPRRFFERTSVDFPACDLLIVMGTSLVVQPFASMIDEVGKDCPRLLINREKAGTVSPLLAYLGIGGFQFDSPTNVRDVFWAGSCDDGCMELAAMLGWDGELRDMIAREHGKLGFEPVKPLDDTASSSQPTAEDAGASSAPDVSNEPRKTIGGEAEEID